MKGRKDTGRSHRLRRLDQDIGIGTGRSLVHGAGRRGKKGPHVCTKDTLRFDGVWVDRISGRVRASVTCLAPGCHNTSSIPVTGPLERKILSASDPELALTMEG